MMHVVLCCAKNGFSFKHEVGMKVIPVILSGGLGSRLWPLSRQSFPKQFLSFPPSEPSLLQKTLERVAHVADVAPMIVTNEKHRFLVAEQMQASGVEAAKIFLEPEGRNTAPAVAIAALAALAEDPQAVLLVFPADHRINDVEEFQGALTMAIRFAASGYLATFSSIVAV